MIIYTSGTTGRPKGAVHTHGGFPIKAAQDMRTASTCTRTTHSLGHRHGLDDGAVVVFGTLMLGATMVLYDGAPDYPAARIACGRWSSATASPRSASRRPRCARSCATATRRCARTIFPRCAISAPPASRGTPTVACGYFQTRRRRHACRSSTTPAAPRSPAASSCGNVLTRSSRAPSPARARAWPPTSSTSAANPCAEKSASSSIRKPWIGMTRGFWRDPRALLRNVLVALPGHLGPRRLGAIDEDGLWYILGRSDDTIKIAGKRVGPAEVESVLVAHRP